MKLYHGSSEIVERPLSSKGRSNLDFGPGFYLTNLREQALGQLKYKKINHQICILNQEVLDKCLKFVKYEIIEEVGS